MLSSRELFILFTRLMLIVVNLLLNFNLPLTKQINYTRKLLFIRINLVYEGIYLQREQLY